jgi:hypothetical protein
MSEPTNGFEPPNENQNSADADNDSEDLPGSTRANHNTAAPSYKEVTRDYFKPATDLWVYLVWRWIKLLANWLRPYDGLITAFATIFIAWFTIELATYAGHQNNFDPSN